jgi:ketosteroid isomerase-like protein
MNDEYAIQRVINIYSQEASLLNWEKVLPLYMADAVWSVPHLGIRRQGHAEIRAQLDEFASWMEFVLQANSPAVIDVDGDSATARSSAKESGKFKGRDEGFEFIFMYVDRLTRTADGWKFAERTVQFIGMNAFPLVARQG